MARGPVPVQLPRWRVIQPTIRGLTLATLKGLYQNVSGAPSLISGPEGYRPAREPD
ncbi:MAG: hypothetical protein JO150_06555 [Acidobacteriaceae bacterium]|nr:hypothetical protein [Acidobacteriaceae bacterium]